MLALFGHRNPTCLSECMAEGQKNGSPEAPFCVALVLGLGHLPGRGRPRVCTVGPLKQRLAKPTQRNVSLWASCRDGTGQKDRAGSSGPHLGPSDPRPPFALVPGGPWAKSCGHRPVTGSQLLGLCLCPVPAEERRGAWGKGEKVRGGKEC